jgi:hypothetical protein
MIFRLIWRDQFGGCQPAPTHSRLTITAMALFSRSAMTVARPHAVRPMTRVPSSLQAKCCSHFCRRGLNSLTRFPVSGSNARVCVPLKPLYILQARQRLSSSSVPPTACGIICSISSFPKTYLFGLRQYSQRYCARARTRAPKALAIIVAV